MQAYTARRRKRAVWDECWLPGHKVLATRRISNDLKSRFFLPGDPRSGEATDCNWDGVRRNRLRRCAAVCAGCAVGRGRECSAAFGDSECREYDGVEHGHSGGFERRKHSGGRGSSIEFRKLDIVIRVSRVYDSFRGDGSGYFARAIADEPELGPEPLLRQCDHGHSFAGDAATDAR
jgi:hypothetical protein